MACRSSIILSVAVFSRLIIFLCFLGSTADLLQEELDDDVCIQPPPPMNGELNCFEHKTRSDRIVCKAKCEAGFQFPNGNRTARHVCNLKSGRWNPTYAFDDCIHICNPPCENGGQCTDGNHCVCTPEYRGDRCQYGFALCDPEKNFHSSGNWSCNHTSSETTCVLSCAQGTRFDSNPANEYFCNLNGLWTPSFAPKCVPINIIEPPVSQNFYHISYGQAVYSKQPNSGVCATWSASHYRTFDGGVYNFQGSCSYLLAKDCELNTFAIHLTNPALCETIASCLTIVSVYIGSEEYILVNGEDGPSVHNGEENYPIPTSLHGLLFQMLSDYVTVTSSLGFRLKWNRKNTVLLEVSKQLRNKTCGLCGKFDGSILNDFETSDGSITDSVEGFVNSWAMESLIEKCVHQAVVKDPCSGNQQRTIDAERECQVLFSDKFSSCHQFVDPKAYFEACKMDYCGCTFDSGSCHCNSLSEYFRECTRLGGKIEGGWRSSQICPLACPNDMVYTDCGTSCPQTCKGTVYDCEDDHCVDGCHCPTGAVLHNGRCIEKRECPCLHNGVEHHSSARVLQECNACECNAGKWDCTNEKCEGRCSSTGDPHYTTFDGLSYEFLGACSYYLVYHENFTIVQENGPCSELGNSEPETDFVYCTHAIKIESGENSLKLRPGIKVKMNKKSVDLPYSDLGFNVFMATDLFLKVKLSNGVSLLWDGRNRIYIDVPPTLYGHTMGLCGTFNKNQNDDFLTPDRDLEADVSTFAERWKASGTCQKRSRRSHRSPCETQPQKLADAELLCSIIDSDIFKDCHGDVEPAPFYKSCVQDLCLCGEKLENCVCPIIADYSMACSKKGIILNWVDDLPVCQMECPSGQVYMECGNPCTSSCASIASDEDCKAECVQGCTCGEGMTMNAEGICIPIDQCPCHYNGQQFTPSTVSVQGSSICTCHGAKWQCRPGSLAELTELNPGLMMNDQSFQKIDSSKCLDENNEEFTDCMETCPQTCQNKHLLSRCLTEECIPGCRCKNGYILDTDLKKCVEVSQCGCLHAGRIYNEGDTITQSCNLCHCEQGMWQCTEKVCPGICTSWGESHFKSYDGKIFDFHGECEYILSKGKMKGASFTLIVQNVPCGTSGVTCSKSFTLELGTLITDRGDMDEEIAKEEKITLTKDDPIPKPNFSSRFVVLESGLFVLIYTDVGITLRWDRGTRIYVILDPKWRRRVQGLCGNFNDDQSDDFCTPSGGLSEVSANIFADSWKVHEFCPKPQIIEDMCAIHPQRNSWAQQKCGILKSDVFAPCRDAVSLDPFYERCVFDSCACDMGGDCDCLCTAIAAYAQECSMHGVHIKWRSQHLCPIQCEECAIYDSCISPCPKKTCENEFKFHEIQESCAMDFCVEGCNPKPCPQGQIYNNEKEYKCIPKADCVVPCLEINGRLYNEGERINDAEVADSCQSCHCQRGAITCVGNPCSKEQPIKACLQSGWTPWMNTPLFLEGDFEDLSEALLKSSYEKFCGISNVTGIECRVAETKEPYQESMQNVICELPHGFMCKNSDQKHSVCKDYEIRLFCDCGPELYVLTTTPPTLGPLPTLSAECNRNGWTPWMSSRLPDEDGEMETLERLRVNHYFCAEHEIENIECRSVLSWTYVSDASEDVICNRKLGLICKGPNCQDYEVRVFCNCAKEETTTAKPSCVTGWTEYFNVDRPSKDNPDDDETIETIRKTYDFCDGGTLEEIECKTLINGDLVDYTSMDTFGLKCSKNVGFSCIAMIRPDACPDFMVRFYCICEEITIRPTTRLIPTTTVSPATHVPVECGWTPWLNIDTPDITDDDEGDIEDLAEIQALYKTCGGKDLVDIECRMSRTLHPYSESLQNNLLCDTKYGFICRNEDQIGKCYDYEIRLLCMYDWCYPQTTTPIPTTKQPTTTENPCPVGQVYDICAYKCSQMCSSFLKQMSPDCQTEDTCIPGCRPANVCEHPNVWRDYHSCVKKEECTCIFGEGDNATIVAPNDVIVKDCEKCQCVHDDLNCYTAPECITTKKPAETRIITLEDILQEDCWTKWINIDIPSTGGGDLEVLNNIRKHYTFCFDPVKIECRTSSSKKRAYDIEQAVKCDLETGLVCWNSDNSPEECYDYEIRFYCPCPTTTVQTTIVTTPMPTFQPGVCVYGWTEWINTHYPDNRGDFESIQKSRTKHIFCDNNMISAIECRQVGTFETGVLQHSVHCDLETGLLCINEYLNGNEECSDYEVRFFCDCPTVAPITEEITTLPPVTTSPPLHVSCAYWSEWINEHHPVSSNEVVGVKTGVKGGGGAQDGDTEKALLLKLQRKYDFCLEGYLSDIECHEAETNLDYTLTGDKKLTCSLYGGFRCRGSNQDNKVCKDYKIRYFCSCEHTTTTVLTKPTTPTVYIKPCTVFYNVIDGPLPIPDSRIKASSSMDSESGPQSSRLSSTAGYKSAGAWVARDLNELQFIEVDLIEIQPVYGVVTKGRHGHQEWVTSYKVMYSRDGIAYTYVTNEQNAEEVFNGNFDSDTPVQHIFKNPFEARFVRIQPITYYKEIAMRFDVLGCAEGMTTVQPITVTVPPCIDEMGLDNGNIDDHQIKTSSSKNPETDGRYVRLNTLQTETHSGGWVAEYLDQNQFVQIDLTDVSKLTGVKLQGRDKVPQWVTAFTVSYSNDAISWNPILDSDGEIKIFSGNYDSSTIITVYFPQTIRARYIKIKPFAWKNWIAMRLEIIGCYEPHIVKDQLQTTPQIDIFEGCLEKMGIENHQLPDALITVSSSMPGSDKTRIRLNTPIEQLETGGWVPVTADYKPIVVIDFYGVRNLTGIITQGLADDDYWVMTYNVQYSLDNKTWDSVRDEDTGDLAFPGNFDRNSEVIRLFEHMIQARYLKIIILDYHTGPALRMEILGCFVPYPEITTPTIVPITTTEACVEFGPWISLSDPVLNPIGDKEPLHDIVAASGMCVSPFDIQCRTMVTHKDYTESGQFVTCDLGHGLICRNEDQTSKACYNYEVRIKCWTCGIETTTTLRPLAICPEVPESMWNNCPMSCPEDHACDGYTCVHYLDCPCYREDKKFQPSNILVTSDCMRCECILEGHSNCKPIECPTCLPGQKSELDDHCVCKCVGCEYGTVLCPTTGVCVSEDKWCDGVTDCPDDEIDCPTTPPPITTTTVQTTTIELPIICSTKNLEDTDSCEMVSNIFETFDGLSYQYDICDHVLMRESSAHLYSVIVSKTCLPDNPLFCQKYLNIDVDGINVKIGPGVDDVTVQNNRIPVSNLWLVSQRFQDFTLKKKGNAIVFSSLKYNFDVTWGTAQDAKITVSKCIMNQVLGLCGLYNGNVDDDRMMPIGKLAKGSQEFGNSWSVGPPERCEMPKCPQEFMKTAIEFCNVLQEKPFSACENYVNMKNRIEACIIFMCDCLQMSSLDARTMTAKDVFYDFYDSESCKCLAYDSFVEACETVKQGPIPEWRIDYGCTPKCPQGMEWQDCGPGCELTCDNYHERDSVCVGECTPGCYCPPGLIRHHNRCVKPKMCQDCVCRGHGDPNFITFDGRYYSFQGICTYVLAQHLSSDSDLNFRILATHVECPEEPHTSCVDGLRIEWNGHTIEKFKNKPVYYDGIDLKPEDSPLDYNNISITFVPGKSTIIHIKPINLAVRYFDQMYGFNIELPAFYYYNQTEGLCGVCNFVQSDDIYHKDGYVTEDIDDFAFSWLEETERRDECKLPKVEVPEPPPGICNFTLSSCEVFLNPSLYAQSCKNDVSYSHKPEASMCRSKFQYAQQCCERGISLVEWLKLSGCENTCPEGMIFECTSACIKTCDNYKNYQVDDCDLMPLYTCSCPESQVLKLGKCVDSITCETCDELGHIVGDVWSLGPCETCECRSDLSTVCTETLCPELPICREMETLEKIERGVNACCDAYHCREMGELHCPDPQFPDCREGESQVMNDLNGCPVYECKCMPFLCPPSLKPLLEEGEDFTLETEDCCPHYKTKCYPERCSLPPECGPGFELGIYEGKCCTKYSCVSKKNICVYEYEYEVVNGTQFPLSPNDYYNVEFEPGSSWRDGLCRNCTCNEVKGHYDLNCRIEKCPDLSEFPDFEKYVRKEIHVPGACCPEYRRVACKAGGVEYMLEEKWPSPDGNPCIMYSCVSDKKGEATILATTTSCHEECQTHEKYVPPSPDSGKCCGICKPVACEEDEVLYQDGQSWISSKTPCYTAECTVKDNGTLITYRREGCPQMSSNCPKENVRTDPQGCCTYCKQSTENCSAVQVPTYETRGFFSYVDKDRGLCSNQDILENLTKCAGQCSTESLYSNIKGEFESVCNCCVPQKTSTRPIILTCGDNGEIKKFYEQPLSCKCSSCSGNDRSHEDMNQIEPY